VNAKRNDPRAVDPRRIIIARGRIQESPFMRWVKWIPRLILAMTAWVRRSLTPTKFVWVSPSGVGYMQRPDWQEAHSPDQGQHDWVKRALRIWWYRISNNTGGSAGSLHLSVVGLGTEYINVPVLMPLGPDIAIACRRLGFSRLMRAANPTITDEEIAATHSMHELAVTGEAERRYTVNMETLSGWDEARMRFPFVFEDRSQTIAMLTVGALDRPDLIACPPLLPLASSYGD